MTRSVVHGAPWRRQIGIYAVFVALVSLFTWPLILHPGSSLRGLNDPFLFTWVLEWVASHLWSAPGALFDTNIFYPYASTLAFSELLLLPALVPAAAIHWLSGNPILAYNITLLLYQALCGWSAYYAASRLTGSTAGGWLAGIAFAVCPFRTGYYDYFNIQMSFAIPVAMLAYVRFLEHQRLRYLIISLALVWLQATTIWYGAIPLGMLMLLLTAGFALLRPAGWRWQTGVALAVGGVVLLAALLPLLWPYLAIHSELGLERTIADAIRHRADWFSYLDPGRDHRFYRLADSGRYPGLFAGFTVYALAAFALVRLFCARAGQPRSRRAGLALGIAAAGTAALLLGALTAAGRAWLGLGPESTLLLGLVLVLLGLGGAGLAVRGRAWLATGRDRRLGRRDWAVLLGVAGLFFCVVTLGPVMFAMGHPVGVGLYGFLHDYFPPLRAIRSPLRLGYMPMWLLGLLAAFGLAALGKRLRGRWRWWLALAPVALAVEFVSFPLAYHRVDWNTPPAVYRWLADQPDQFAVLEWPTNLERIDSIYVFWSMLHGKHEISGVSGFFPPFTARVVHAMQRLPAPGALRLLRSVYPLRYLIVHLDYFYPTEQRQTWQAWQQHPPAGLRFVRRFGQVLVFELTRAPEQAITWQRTFSTPVVTARPRARVSVAQTQPSANPDIERYVEARFNDRVVGQLKPGAAASTFELALAPPYPRADRNRLALRSIYRITGERAAARYAIGSTGVVSPVDIEVRAGLHTGQIRVNGADYSPEIGGYDVVVIDPKTGIVDNARAFFTFRHEQPSHRLADYLAAVPDGRIVVVATDGRGSRLVTDDAVAALHSIGGAVDPRPAYPYSHAIIGVKGAPPGSALERWQRTDIELAVGEQRAAVPITVRGFELER